MSKEYSEPIADIAKDFLDKDEWNYRFLEDEGMFRFGLKLEEPSAIIDSVMDIGNIFIMNYTWLRDMTADPGDEEMLKEMEEFVCKINFGMHNGCFEFDPVTGDIRFRSFIDCEETLPSSSVIKNAVYVSFSMMRKYTPGILGILTKEMDAEEAFNICEAERDFR